MSTGLQALLAIGQMAGAGQKNREAKKLERNLVTPDYEIAQPILDNQAFAESRNSQGLSDAAMVGYNDNINRSLTSSIDAILRGGGSVNNIADLYDTVEDDFSKVAMIDEEIRMKNASNYLSQNEKLAEEMDKQWQVNEWAPYQDQRQLIASLRGQAQAQKGQGLSLLGGAVNNFVVGSQLAADPNNGGTGAGTPPNIYLEATRGRGRIMASDNFPHGRDPYRPEVAPPRPRIPRTLRQPDDYYTPYSQPYYYP